MRYLFGCFLALFIFNHTFAQYTTAENERHSQPSFYAETITADDLKSYLSVLASDSLEGRETGTRGNEMAAQFLAEKIRSFGIPPVPGTGSYFQEVDFTRMKWDDLSLTINGNTVQHKRDFVMVPTINPNSDIRISEDAFVFMGYGIDDPAYSDYNNRDVAGKVVLIYSGEPMDKDGNFLVSGNQTASAWSLSFEKKLEAAQKAGVRALLVIDSDIREKAAKYRGELIGGITLMGPPEAYGADYPPNLWLSPTIAKEMLGKRMKKVIRARKKISRKGKLKPVEVDGKIKLDASMYVSSMPGVNVLAYIEGTDPDLKDELVVISAHYDHLGKHGDDIYNGADDNGSGTSGVLEIAQAFQVAREKGAGPRRSVLCLFVTGEEKGLLGSQFYSEHPIFPLENTVADINIDMIGRVDELHQDSNYIYVIGSDRLSTELHRINEENNALYTKLELDYTYNAEDDPNRFYYRSDHYNFAKHGIPSIFFFSGTHEDYHRPSDTVDKIMFGKAAIIARLAFYNAWELANRDERIRVDVKPKT